ncbi:cell division protein FtsL [Roseixanthobacter glucoisosaccharinicivorans]|uniref:cell division protein FtsL n=1 Tax=Roseixanthobacter glucoisosaccharinicivorans TaxID=3119923 RepID=UPI0037287DA8
MFRVANLVMVLALLATAGVVYQVKYASMAEAERLAHLRQAIRKERDAIAVMRAEWARRTSPLYVQGLVQRHLDLQPLTVDAISTLDDLPEKPATNSDSIGGMLEALVDAPLTTSSVGKPAAAKAEPAAPSAASSANALPTGGGAAVLPSSSALRPANAPVRAKPVAPVASAAPRQQSAPNLPFWAPKPVAPAPSYASPTYASPSYAPPRPAAPAENALAPMLPPGSLPANR